MNSSHIPSSHPPSSLPPSLHPHFSRPDSRVFLVIGNNFLFALSLLLLCFLPSCQPLSFGSKGTLATFDHPGVVMARIAHMGSARTTLKYAVYLEKDGKNDKGQVWLFSSSGSQLSFDTTKTLFDEDDPRGFAVGILNSGDTCPDLLLSRDNLFSLRNTAPSSCSSFNSLALQDLGGCSGSGDMSSLKIVDVNNDGRNDILYTCKKSGDEMGGYMLAKPQTITPDSNDYYVGEIGNSNDLEDVRTINYADFDNDGDMDVVVSADKGLGAVVYIMNWSGWGSATQRSIPYASVGNPTNIENAYPCDVNNDGFADIVLLYAVNGRVGISLNNNGNSFLTPIVITPSVSTASTDLVCKDLDGDGFPEIIVASTGSNDIVIGVNDKNSFQSLSSWTSSYAGGGSVENLEVADVDGDGFLDLIIADRWNQVVYKRINTAQCPAGKYMPVNDNPQIGNACALCPANSIRASSTSESSTLSACSACATSKVASEDRKTCTNCPVNTFLTDTSSTRYCNSCGKGMFLQWSGTTGSCVPCGAGRYNSDDTQLGASTTCQVCNDGFISPAPGAAECTKCETGKTSNSEHLACEPCQPGTYLRLTDFQCVSCEAGKYTDEMGQIECKTCGADEYSNNNAVRCEPCPPDKVSYPGSSSCYDKCPAGLELSIDTFVCVPCSSGKYSTAFTGGKECSDCDEGKHASSTGAQYCDDCGIDTFADETGLANCNPCETNTFANGGATTCVVCDVGTFIDGAAGAKVCEACPVGKYSNTKMTVSCTLCAPGKYNDAPGNTACEGVCEAGTHNPSSGGESIADCIECAEGKYTKKAAQSTCLDCPGGTFQPAPGGAGCLECEPGKNSVEGATECSGLFIKSITPEVGDTRGGDVVLLLGTELDLTSVMIGNGDRAAPCEVFYDAPYISNSTHLWCKTPGGSGNAVNVKITKNEDDKAYVLMKGLFSYKAPVVQKVTGCLQNAVQVFGEGEIEQNNFMTYGCPTTGGILIEIEGDFFGVVKNDLVVQIEDTPCTNHKLLNNQTKIQCELPMGAGENLGVTVSVREQATTSKLLSYMPPAIYSVAGCGESSATVFNGAGLVATEECPRAGGIILTITGSNFGPQNPIFMVGGVVCEPNPDASYSYNSSVQQIGECVLPAGSGSLRGVNAIQINGLISKGVGLVSYDKCRPGTFNMLNQSLGYFTCHDCTGGFYSTTEEAFSCTMCLSGSFTEENDFGLRTNCTLCATKVPGSTSTFDGAQSISDCVCDAFTYFDSRKGDDGSCVSCVGMTGVDCTRAGMSLETLRIIPGYWRTGPLSTNIMHCWNPEACIGSVNSTDHDEAGIDGSGSSYETTNYCLEGYEGPYCEICSQGYSSVFGSCELCGEKTTGSIAWTVVGGIFAVLFVVFTARIVNGFSKKTKKGLLIAGKLFVSTIQILMAVPQVFEVVLPANLMAFFAFFNVFNLSFIQFFRIGCSFRVNIHHVLLSATLVPFVCTIPVLIMWAYHYQKEAQFSHTLKMERHALKMNTISLLLSVTYFFLPSASMAIFAVFPCDYMDDDTQWLKNDYQISCDPDNVEHNGYLVYASIMTCVFPVGIPTLYLLLLYKDRKLLNPNPKGHEPTIIERREKDQKIQHTIFLWGSYRPTAWWFEIFECIRRILLTGALVFVQQGSQTQVALGTLICIVCGIIFALVWPYATFRDNVLGMLSHCQLIGTLFSAMMFKVGKNADSAYDQYASGWLLIALNGLVFLIMFFWVMFEVAVEEGPGLRSRERQFMMQASFILTGGSTRFNAEGEDIDAREPGRKTEHSGPGVELKTMNSRSRNESAVHSMGVNPMRSGRRTTLSKGGSGHSIANVDVEQTRSTALSSLTNFFSSSFRRSAATSRATSSRAPSTGFEETDEDGSDEKRGSSEVTPPPLPTRGPPLPTRGPPLPTRGPPTLSTIVSSVKHNDSVESEDSEPPRPQKMRSRSSAPSVMSLAKATGVRFAPTPTIDLHSAKSWENIEQEASEDAGQDDRKSSFAVDGWIRIWSDVHNAYYYHNEATGETSWEIPE